MAINQKTWNNNDHIGVSESQNVQDNSVNTTDEIHPQYQRVQFYDYVTIYGMKFTTANGFELKNNNMFTVVTGTGDPLPHWNIMQFENLANLPFTKVNITFTAKVSQTAAGGDELIQFQLHKSNGGVVGTVQKASSDFGGTIFETFSNLTIDFSSEANGETLSLKIIWGVNNVDTRDIEFKNITVTLIP